jgi:hypothetical protein
MRMGLVRRVGGGRSIVAVAAVVAVVSGCFLGAGPVKYPGFGGQLDVADLNEDGHPDIVSCSGTLLNDGAGAFPTSSPGCGVDAIDATTGDVDGDGHVDRVVLSTEPSAHQRISLFPGDGTGGFGAEAWALGDIFPTARAVAVGDLDGDDRTDVVFETSQDGELLPQGYQVLLAVAGPERFAAPVSYPDDIGPQPFSPQSLVLRDIDGDGDLDLVTVGSTVLGHPEAGVVVVALNDGTGAFPAPTSYPVTPPGGRFTSATVGGPAILDVDRNGTLDVVATTDHVDMEGVRTTCLAVLRGDVSGGLQQPECLPAPSRPYGLLGEGENTGDFDHDGDTDLLTTRGVLEGDGSGGFPTFNDFGRGDDAVAADFDGDGRPDVARSTDSGISQQAVSVYMNRL